MTSVEREDQDAGLAQRLAEEAEDPQPVDVAQDAAAELGDLAEAGEPVARDCQPGSTHAQRITVISGWVASSVCVKT